MTAPSRVAAISWSCLEIMDVARATATPLHAMRASANRPANPWPIGDQSISVDRSAELEDPIAVAQRQQERVQQPARNGHGFVLDRAAHDRVVDGPALAERCDEGCRILVRGRQVAAGL